jgi:hypothetical protein
MIFEPYSNPKEGLPDSIGSHYVLLFVNLYPNSHQLQNARLSIVKQLGIKLSIF